ncbi:MAG TPA: hypothetical protein VNF68_01445 [Candidatus Baltobacteraceae bacterium]|nr:hypothetical protein [Candidatus Baltobacteraceae bacterium]
MPDNLHAARCIIDEAVYSPEMLHSGLDCCSCVGRFRNIAIDWLDSIRAANSACQLAQFGHFGIFRAQIHRGDTESRSCET